LDVKLSSEKIEVATLTRRDEKSVIRLLSKPEIDKEIQEHDERERIREEQEAAKRMAPGQQWGVYFEKICFKVFSVLVKFRLHY